MKHVKTILLVSTLFMLASYASGQAGDWQAVKDLQPGTKISVLYGVPFHVLCVFDHATDEQLICERVLHGPHGGFGSRERGYRRDNIKEVRLEHSDAANIATGVAIGGGIGVAVGVGTGRNATRRGEGGLLLGGLGALFGGAFGRDFPIAHGKVIYRQ